MGFGDFLDGVGDAFSSVGGAVEDVIGVADDVVGTLNPASVLSAIIPGSNPILDLVDSGFDNMNPFQMAQDAIGVAKAIPGVISGVQDMFGWGGQQQQQQQGGQQQQGQQQQQQGMQGQTCKPLDCYARCQEMDRLAMLECKRLNEEFQLRMEGLGCPKTKCYTKSKTKSCRKYKRKPKAKGCGCGA